MAKREETPVPTPEQVRMMSTCDEKTAQVVSNQIAAMDAGDRPVTLNQVQQFVQSVERTKTE